MKIYFISLVLLLIGCIHYPAIEDNNVMITNQAGQVIGYIENDGMITNEAGQVVGYIESDNTITNEAGQAIINLN